MIKEIINYGKGELIYNQKLKLTKEPDLRNLFWETTLRCNAKCKHCGSRAGENCKIKDELTTEEIKNCLKSISDKMDAKKILLNITGGEPLLREDLFEVMDYACNELGFRWGITTNGMLINDKIIQKMKDTQLRTMSISIDGMEKSHDNFRGIKGAFKKTIQNIKKLQKEKFLRNFQITTVINKLNIDELDDMYKLMQELEVDSWRIVNMDPIGRAIDNNKLALDKDDYIRLFDFMREKRNKSQFEITYGCAHFLGMKRENTIRDYSFFCFAGLTIASILYNGDIFVCPDVPRRKELIQGNVRVDDFVDVWYNKFEWYRDINKFKVGKCGSCKNYKYCLDDSLHTWDFDNNEPKLCLSSILE